MQKICEKVRKEGEEEEGKRKGSRGREEEGKRKGSRGREEEGK